MLVSRDRRPSLSEPRFDIVAIGNALVDVICHKDDAFVAAQGLAKGQMCPIAPAQALRLHDDMGACEEVSGGSAANTLAATAALGLRCAFVGQVGDDRLGRLFADDMATAGIGFPVAALADGTPTGRCLIIVTPDGHRTMNTAIGASEYLPIAGLDHSLIADAAILYIEGYMWRTAEPRAAAQAGIVTAHAHRRKVAFTLSSEFCIEQHGDDFRALLAGGAIDILFANEGELHALTGLADFDAAVDRVAAQVPLVFVTRGADGAIAVEAGVRHAVAAEPIGPVVDTTGAGDLFAAGVFAGIAGGHDLGTTLRMGSVAAGKIITLVGPRIPAHDDLAALIAERLDSPEK